MECDARWNGGRERNAVVERNLVEQSRARLSTTTLQHNWSLRGFSDVFCWVNDREALACTTVVYNSNMIPFEQSYLYLVDAIGGKSHVAVFSVSDTGNVYGFYVSGPFGVESPAPTRSLFFAFEAGSLPVRSEMIALQTSILGEETTIGFFGESSDGTIGNAICSEKSFVKVGRRLQGTIGSKFTEDTLEVTRILKYTCVRVVVVQFSSQRENALYN